MSATGDLPLHHPTLHATGRYGCWATCICGWASGLWTTVVGAHLAFGKHLTSPDTSNPKETTGA